MWMMGYNQNSDFNTSDSFYGQKLRPLVPKPVACSNNNSAAASACFNCIHSSDFLTLNHLGSVNEQNKRDFSTQPVVVSSRWNPTPEQLRILEELYLRGTRTPSADQIRHITSQLRNYGKIEGKNVFYWFQNHKARERQKRRRQRESAPDYQQQQGCDVDSLEIKESAGADRTSNEFEENNTNWASSTNFTTRAEQSSVAANRAAAKASEGAECKTDRWIQQIDEGELGQRRNTMEKNDRWQMIQLSCLSHTHHKMDPTLLNSKTRLTNFITNNDTIDEDGFGFGEPQTLQLFPLEKDENNIDEQKNKLISSELPVSAVNTNLTTCYQFFEFLPLKN